MKPSMESRSENQSQGLGDDIDFNELYHEIIVAQSTKEGI